MQNYYHAKASDLLAKIANSVYEREKDNTRPLLFTSAEVTLVETWLTNFIRLEIRDFILKNEKARGSGDNPSGFPHILLT